MSAVAFLNRVSIAFFISAIPGAAFVGAAAADLPAAVGHAPDRPTSSGRVLRAFRLYHVSAADAAELIKAALSPEAVVTFPPRFEAGPGQVLHVSDRPENVERAERVLRILESAGAAGGARRLAGVAGDGMPTDGGPPGLREALEQDDGFRRWRDAVHELDLALTVPALPERHPMMLKLRRQRDELLRELRGATERVRTRLESEAKASRAVTRLGLTVSRAPSELGRRLKLPEGSGLVVEQFTPGGAGEAAGVLPRDILWRLDDQMLVNAEQLDVVVGSLEPGKEAPLLLFRDGERLRRSVKTPAPVSAAPVSRGH